MQEMFCVSFFWGGRFDLESFLYQSFRGSLARLLISSLCLSVASQKKKDNWQSDGKKA
jgi:hypothetical protein